MFGKNQIFFYSRINMAKTIRQKGFTLIEILIALGLFTGLVVLLTTFQKDIFVNNTFIQNSLVVESEARGALKKTIAELRAAVPSNNGLYPIILADKNSLTFFSDVNRDGLRERVRYFVTSSSLKRGVTPPTGSPYIYLDANESLFTVVHTLVNPTTTPVFNYYDDTYTGSSSPLAWPVNVSDIRLIKMTIMVDVDPVRSPTVMTFESQVTIRNLKDNL
jgi:prepilin-type N-terminal cleavage/methylation domain-containing protein